MPLDQNPHQTVTRLFNLCVRVFCVSNVTVLLVYISAKIKMSFIWKDDCFLPNSASSVSRSPVLDDQLASTLEPIELCMASYQGLYTKFISMRAPKCSSVEHDAELMLMVLHAHFLPQQQYSWVYALFLAFHGLIYRWGCQFLSLFYKITNIRSWRCFSSSKIRTQLSHTFCNITMIFKVMSQYFPALSKRIYNHISLGERIKLIIFQIRHKH